MSLPSHVRTHGWSYGLGVLQLIAAAGLAIDAKIHLDLASTYDAIKSSTVSQGDLFRIEGGLAIVAGLLVLVWRRPISALIALGVAGGGLVPLLVYRYYDVGAIGPLPPMYEPVWYPDKTDTLIAQIVAAVAALALLVLLVVRKRRRNIASGPIRSTSTDESTS
jgi:hypothetical protein